jgi:hypothetical protein
MNVETNDSCGRTASGDGAYGASGKVGPQLICDERIGVADMHIEQAAFALAKGD